MPARRTRLIKLSLLLIWPLLFVPVAEVTIRLFTDHPVNRTSHTIPDSLLGQKMDPSFKGIDDNGFRNPIVLASADIVTIGDSHTYGNNADAKHAWPAQLAKLSGLQVYNFGIGGYGPVHYAILIDEALKLSPRDIVIGLYLPNDIHDIKRDLNRPFGARWAIENEMAEWARGDAGEDEGEDDLDWEDWLLDQSAIVSVVRAAARRNKKSDKGVIPFEDKLNPTYFELRRLAPHRDNVNLKSGEIDDAFNLLLKILEQANAKAARAGVRLHVAIIPSKERVFYPTLVERDIKLPKDFHLIAKDEGEAVARIEAFLDEIGVPYVDILPALQAALTEKPGLYPPDGDGHPVAPGYLVYAETIWGFLQEKEGAAPDTTDSDSVSLEEGAPV